MRFFTQPLGFVFPQKTYRNNKDSDNKFLLYTNVFHCFCFFFQFIQTQNRRPNPDLQKTSLNNPAQKFRFQAWLNLYTIIYLWSLFSRSLHLASLSCLLTDSLKCLGAVRASRSILREFSNIFRMNIYILWSLPCARFLDVSN